MVPLIADWTKISMTLDLEQNRDRCETCLHWRKTKLFHNGKPLGECLAALPFHGGATPCREAQDSEPDYSGTATAKGQVWVFVGRWLSTHADDVCAAWKIKGF
jgi:hypothetical protein